MFEQFFNESIRHSLYSNTIQMAFRCLKKLNIYVIRAIHLRWDERQKRFLFKEAMIPILN